MQNDKKVTSVTIPDEALIDKIFLIRGQKVMLDRDLSALYGVQTKRLNEQVKRNIERFPEDFMFQLSEAEFKDLKSQFATSRWGGVRKQPYVFTEYGILMLSSILRSSTAIAINIQIIRVYSRLRKLISTNSDILARLDSMEGKLANHDKKLLILFEALKKLANKKEKSMNESRRIGYRRSDEPE